MHVGHCFEAHVRYRGTLGVETPQGSLATLPASCGLPRLAAQLAAELGSGVSDGVSCSGMNDRADCSAGCSASCGAAGGVGLIHGGLLCQVGDGTKDIAEEELRLPNLKHKFMGDFSAR